MQSAPSVMSIMQPTMHPLTAPAPTVDASPSPSTPSQVPRTTAASPGPTVAGDSANVNDLATEDAPASYDMNAMLHEEALEEQAMEANAKVDDVQRLKEFNKQAIELDFAKNAVVSRSLEEVFAQIVESPITSVKYRKSGTVATYISRYQRILQSLAVLSILLTDITDSDTDIDLVSLFSLDSIKKFGIDSSALMMVLQYHHMLPYIHPVSEVLCWTKEVFVREQNGTIVSRQCEKYHLPIAGTDPDAAKIYPLGLGPDHLDTTLAAVKWLCEVSGRLNDGDHYRKVVAADGSTQFWGSPTKDTKVQILVKNLKKAWEIGGASSVSCSTFEPIVLQNAYQKIKAETNSRKWVMDMQAYLCVLLGIATSSRGAGLRDILVQDFEFSEHPAPAVQPTATNPAPDPAHRDAMQFPSYLRVLIPSQKNSPAAIFTIHGSCNVDDALFEGDIEFHLPALLLAYFHVTGRSSGYLFSSADDGSSRPNRSFVTNAVKRIAKLGGIQLASGDPESPRFSAHSLRRTAIHRALRCNTSALDVRDMTAHKDSLVLATYTTNARAEGAKAMRELGLEKDPWLIYWPFRPVERVVPGASGTITSTAVAQLRPAEKQAQEDQVAHARNRLAAKKQLKQQQQQQQSQAGGLGGADVGSAAAGADVGLAAAGADVGSAAAGADVGSAAAGVDVRSVAAGADVGSAAAMAVAAVLAGQANVE